MFKYCCLILISLLLMANLSCSNMQSMHGNEPVACKNVISPDCAQVVTPAFDKNGQLWLAFVSGEHIYVTRQVTKGKFSPATRVNSLPEALYADGENRPKIALGDNGNIYVSWTQKTPAKYSGNIRFSRSLDGGKSFEEPRTINDDGLVTSHRFDAMQLTLAGDIYLVWLDKRDKVASIKAGGEYSGAAVYYTVSRDEGASFVPNQKIVDHSCECCRIAIDSTTQNEVVIFWRQLFSSGSEIPYRDHALVSLTDENKNIRMVRATRDNWAINACPHHGPDIHIDETDTRHLVWFTNSESRKGLYYKKLSKAETYISAPENKNKQAMLVDSSPGASHPQVFSKGKRVVIAWKRFDGKQTHALWMNSNDGGNTWSKEAIAATSSDDGDHPLLVSNNHQVYLSWLNKEHGYQLVVL